ncbi:MAG: recombinase family protein [Acidobacteria bacterium]|nr:recombinase family protein [Acidobacteriota bacterium]
MTETHSQKRLIGYARVSTFGQTLDSQLEQLREAGCSSRNIYKEKVTGARPDRRELLRMLERLEPGDMVRPCCRDAWGQVLVSEAWSFRRSAYSIARASELEHPIQAGGSDDDFGDLGLVSSRS